MRRQSPRIAPRLHVKAASNYPEKLAVPKEHVPWSVDCDYCPAEVNRFDLIEKWAPEEPRDASTIAQQIGARVSYEGPIVQEPSTGRPLNPRGRTGVKGRGLLEKWGPNQAADPIVTRFDPARPPVVQMVAIRRKHGAREWAIPGGMVDPGEHMSQTVRREFVEEAGNISDPAMRARFDELTEQLFASGTVVYQGYVDDPRNTDNAWMETTAYHFHCPPELGEMLPLEAGDDATDVMWLDVDDSEPKYHDLYASHKEWVDTVAVKLRRVSELKSKKKRPRE